MNGITDERGGWAYVVGCAFAVAVAVAVARVAGWRGFAVALAG